MLMSNGPCLSCGLAAGSVGAFLKQGACRLCGCAAIATPLTRLPLPSRWMLDLGVSTDIAGIVIAMRTAVSDLKISIGDSESPLSNEECSVGVQIEPNATSAQVRRGAGVFCAFSSGMMYQTSSAMVPRFHGFTADHVSRMPTESAAPPTDYNEHTCSW